jgi:hypothetical protein
MTTHEDTINELSKQLDGLKSDTPSSTSSNTSNTNDSEVGIKEKAKALVSKACTRPCIYYIIAPIMILTGLILAKPTFIMTQDDRYTMSTTNPHQSSPFNRFPGPKGESVGSEQKPLCICKTSLSKWVLLITAVVYAIIFYNSQDGAPASCGAPTCKLF